MHRYCTDDLRVFGDGQQPRCSYGSTFTFDAGHIYIRSLDSLICIGR